MKDTSRKDSSVLKPGLLPTATGCSWCHPKPEFPNIRDGFGSFADVDVDFNTFSYPGIPVCGGCGGIGLQYNTEDFKTRTSRIMELRFQFHPVDSLPEPPEALIYHSLRELVEQVKSLSVDYGPIPAESFAAEIVAGKYDKALFALKANVDSDIALVKREDITNDVAKQATISAILALLEGKFEEGYKLFEEAITKYPDNSVIQHDYGVVLVTYKRDAENALKWFINATKLDPKKTLHFYQTAKLLKHMKRHGEAMWYLEEAEKQPDFDDFVREHSPND